MQPRPTRMSRRTAIVTTAGAAGFVAAGGLAWYLRSSDETPAGPLPAATHTAPPSSQPTAVATPEAPTRQPVRGGIAHLVAAGRYSFDTFDAVRSGEPSIAEVLGRTHQRLVEWSSFGDGVLGPGLATGWEQPAHLSWTFAVDPAAVWLGEGVERAATADDVATHLQRVVAEAAGGSMPLSQRPWDYATIERIEATSDREVRIYTTAPDPFLLETLAGPLASIQSPETIDAYGDLLHERRPEHLVGTGPFIYQGTGPGGSLRFAARPGGPALLDGLVVHPAGGSIDTFLARATDELITFDRRDAADVRRASDGSVVESVRLEASPVVSTLHVGGPPWEAPGLRRALSAALNRGWLAEHLFAGRAVPASYVLPAAATGFGLDDAELATYPGFRDDPEEDAREARALWSAAAGEGLGELTIDFPAIFEPAYSASSLIVGRLREILGVDVRPAVDSYTNIAGKVASGYYGNGRAALWFGWGSPLPSPDPSRYLAETSSSGSATARAAGYTDDVADGLLDSLAVEFNAARRADLVGDVERRLLETMGGGLIPWLQQANEHFHHAFLVGPPRAPFWDQHLDGGRWLDPEADGYGARQNAS